MIAFYFYEGTLFGWGIYFVIFFVIFAIIPTIMCVRLVKQPNQTNVKIILGIAGFLLSYIALLGSYFLQGFLPDTKECHHCGEKILDTAKKCKHCGEWLEK